MIRQTTQDLASIVQAYSTITGDLLAELSEATEGNEKGSDVTFRLVQRSAASRERPTRPRGLSAGAASPMRKDVRREKSEFVLEPAFLELIEGLHKKCALNQA